MKEIEKLKENGVAVSKFIDMDLKEMYDKVQELIDTVNELVRRQPITIEDIEGAEDES